VEELRARGKVYIIIKQSQSQVHAVDIHGGRQSGKLIASGLVKCGLVTVRVIDTWQVILPGFQDGSKVTMTTTG
jgi:hypothetical protein